MKKTEEEILRTVRSVLGSNWDRRDGVVVPSPEDVALDNAAVQMEGAVLYADLAGSSKLTQEYKDYFVAEIYKSFLNAATDVIRNNDGEITAFDGDRVMAVFIGGSKCTNAAKASLQINAVVRKVNELIAERYPSTKYRIDYAVGVDVSKLFVVRTGIRGFNDLAWIGDASNVAAKLSNVRDFDGKSFITKRLFDRMADSSKFSDATKKTCMWNLISKQILGHDIYQSTWWWNL